MIAALVQKLESELYNEGEGDAFEQQHRAGWNTRSRSLLRWIRDQQAGRFDVSDVEGKS